MSLESIPLSSYMTKNVKMIPSDKGLFNVCVIMKENKIGSVIVVDESNHKNPIGIITERDIVNYLSSSEGNLLMQVKEIMSKPLITVEQSASINDATKIMNNKKIRRLVVIDKNNKMIGILTQRDIFKAIDKDPDLFSEFYGNAFSSKFKEIYERYNKYSLED